MNLTKKWSIVEQLTCLCLLTVGFFLGRIASSKFHEKSSASIFSSAVSPHQATLDGAAYLTQMKITPNQHPYSAIHQAKVAACIAEFERKKDTFHYEGDILVRMREIVAEGNTEMELQTNLEARLLFHQWLCSNPRELFSSLALIDIYKLGTSVGYDVTLSHLRTLPDKEVDEILKYAENSLNGVAVQYFRKQIQAMKKENASEEIIAKMMHRSESVRGNCWQAIVAEFPSSMDSQLIDYIIKEDNPNLLLFMRQLRSDQFDHKWLESTFEKHPALVDLIKQHPDVERHFGFTSVAMSTTSGPAAVLPESRISLVRLESPTSIPGGKFHELVRKGELTQKSFQNILQEMDPNLVTDQSNQTQGAIMSALSKSSAEFGIEYLSSISDTSVREKILTSALRECDPDALYQILVALPHDPANGPIEQRYSMWMNRSLFHYRDYGDDYVSWIMELPQGDEREMALSALSTQIKSVDPVLAERLLKAKTMK